MATDKITYIRFFNPDLEFLGEIRMYASLIFIRRWETIGEFEIHVKKQRPELFQNGNYIMLNNDPYRSGIIQYEKDDSDGYEPNSFKDITIKGYSLLYLLYRRITYPPETNNGYRVWTNCSMEDIMYDLVDENAINPIDTNRKIPHLIAGTSQHRGGNLTFQTRLKRVSNELNTLSVQSGLGVSIKLDWENKQLVFEVLEGVDRSYSDSNADCFIFKKTNGKVKQRTYTHSAMGASNMAYIGGQGDGADREIVTIHEELTGLNRWETFIDARDIEEGETGTLVDRGKTKLAEQGESIGFEFEANPVDYRMMWDLGDVTTFYDVESGLVQDNRVTEVTETYEGSTLRIDPVFGHTTTTLSDTINSIVSDGNTERTGISGKFKYLYADNAEIKTLVALKASIEDLTATNANIQNLIVEDARINNALIGKATITDLTAATARIGSLETGVANIQTAIINVAHISDLTAINANIQNLSTQNATINNALILKANIAELTAATARISTLESNTANIGTLTANLANIQTLLAGNIVAGSTQTIMLNATNTTMDVSFIKNLIAENIAVDDLIAGRISTDKFEVGSDDGRLLVADQTIQIKDATRVRVQIGKDASADYNMYVWDASGNLMFDATGLKASGVKSKIIRDDMVSDTANINGAKLNMPSLITAINGQTQTIKSSLVKYDSTNQTLDVVFANLTTRVGTAETSISTNTTAISVANGKISTLISDSSQTVSDLTTLTSNYNSTVSTVSGIQTTIGSHTTQINTATGNITSLQSNVTSLTADLSGFKTTVSQTYATQSALTTTSGLISTAQTTANTAVTNAAAAQTTANTANSTANTATSLLNDLASDSKLTPVEKQQVKMEWDAIVSEKTINDTQATAFGVTTEKTNYGTSYTTLSNYITSLLASLTTTSDIVGTTFRANFKDYYDKRQLLLNAIATKAKALADTAQTAANTANATFVNYSTTMAMNSAIDQKADEITLSVSQTYATQTSLTTTNGLITTAQTTANTAVTNAAAAQTTANTAVANASTAQIAANTANSLLADITNDNKLTSDEKQIIRKEWEVIASEKDKNTAQASTFSVSSATYSSAFQTLANYLNSGTTWSTGIPTMISDANLGTTTTITGSTLRTNFKTYYDARTDLLNAISSKAKTLADTAQTQANTATTDAATAQTTANNAVTAANSAQTTANTANSTANTATSLLNDLASDSKLTPVEKQQVKMEWDAIVSEKTINDTQATAFGITTEKTNYGTAYTTLSSYITSLLSSLTTTSDIVGTTFRANFKDYYDKRQLLLNAIATKAKALADTAQTAANTANATFVNYSTTTAMNSAIDISKDSILSTVSSTYATQTTVNAIPDTVIASTNQNLKDQNLILEFENIVGGSFAGNTFTKTGAAGWSAGFSSVRSFTNGDYIEYTVTNITKAIMFGFNTDPVTDSTYTSIDFAIYQMTTAGVAIYESGVSKGQKYTGLLVGDTLRVAIDNGKIVYFVNGELIYTSLTAPTLPVYMDCSVNTSGSSLNNIRCGTIDRAGLDEQFANYSTTTAMNSAIDQKANEITLSVSQTYATQTSLTTTNGLATTAQTTANTAVTNAAAAQTTANMANSTANTATSLLNDLASDSKLTPVEKQQVKTEWDAIVSEKTINDTQATAFGITTEKTNYGTAYTTLSSYITSLLSSLTTTSDIVGTTFRANFKDYYDKRQLLLNAIATKAKTLADTAQTAANTANATFVNYSTTTAMNSAIDISKSSILSTVSSTYATQASLTTVDGKFANYSTTMAMNSAISQKADEITLSVSSTYATQETVNDIRVAGRNLALNSGVPITTTAYMVKTITLSKNLAVGQKYAVVLKGTITATNYFGVWMNGGSNPVGRMVETYGDGTSHTYIFKITAVAPTTGNEKTLNIYTPPSNTTSKTIDWVTVYEGDIDKPPIDFIPAPEDADAKITTAQTTANTATTNAATAQTTANTATTNINNLTTRVSTAESKLTATSLITTITTGINGGTQFETTKFTMDNTGLTIMGGGLRVQNNAGTNVLAADTSGNLTLAGNVTLTGTDNTLSVKDTLANTIGSIRFKQITGQTWNPGAVGVFANNWLDLSAGNLNAHSAITMAAGGYTLIDAGYDTGVKYINIGTDPITACINIASTNSPMVQAVGATKDVDFTAASGFTKLAGYMNKIVYNGLGKFCFLAFTVSGSIPANTWTTILTLPVGYRPSGTLTYSGNNALAGLSQIRILNTGVVQAWGQNALSDISYTAFYYAA